MHIRLRGHHLLCLLGFRGMGYSEHFAENMRAVYERLRKEPEVTIEIVRGVDDLCCCFPSDQPNHCDQASVHSRDETVIHHLGLRVGEKITWAQILQTIRTNLKPTHITLWCQGCPWLSYGVCEEGVARIAGGGDLAPIQITST
jgi:uncharacterized protein